MVADPASELNDLLIIADILVTDYSSSIFEWALLRRPLVLLVDDLETYQRDPGLYLDFEHDMIGTQVRDTAGVAAAILNDRFDFSTYPPSSPAISARATAPPAIVSWSDCWPLSTGSEIGHRIESWPLQDLRASPPSRPGPPPGQADGGPRLVRGERTVCAPLPEGIPATLPTCVQAGRSPDRGPVSTAGG